MKMQLMNLPVIIAIASCGYSDDHLRANSSVPMIGLFSPEEVERIRLIHGGLRYAILRQCPKGSDRAAVMRFASENFQRQIKRVDSREVSFIINERWFFPVGKNWQEVTFVFNRSNALEDVVVKNASDLWITA